MYFNEKEDTNIDKEFKDENKIDFSKFKKLIIIGVIVLIALIILIIIIFALKNRKSYSFELLGASEMTIYQGTEYIEPGYKATDNKKNDLTSEVIVKNNIDTSTIGTYAIHYTFNNKKLNRTIHVVARPEIPTTIHLSGEKNINLKLGDTFNEPGYTAIDAIDGDLTPQITVTGSVDTSKIGVYRIVYSVVNSGGITASATRTITVE